MRIVSLIFFNIIGSERTPRVHWQLRRTPMFLQGLWPLFDIVGSSQIVCCVYSNCIVISIKEGQSWSLSSRDKTNSLHQIRGHLPSSWDCSDCRTGGDSPPPFKMIELILVLNSFVFTPTKTQNPRVLM